MSKEKKIRIDAFVNKETYEALLNGNAVSNNGLRSTSGNFWSDQPDFSLPNKTADQTKAWARSLTMQVGSYIVLRIALPALEKYVFNQLASNEKAKTETPQVHSYDSKSKQKNNNEPRLNDNKLIYLDDYRKQA